MWHSDRSLTAILHPCGRRVSVTPEAGSRPVGTEASRRSARSPASALLENRSLRRVGRTSARRVAVG
jgi:hypothetical protein